MDKDIQDLSVSDLITDSPGKSDQVITGPSRNNRAAILQDLLPILVIGMDFPGSKPFKEIANDPWGDISIISEGNYVHYLILFSVSYSGVSLKGSEFNRSIHSTTDFALIIQATFILLYIKEPRMRN